MPSKQTAHLFVVPCMHVQCVGVGMDTLTLARYYCELSLMDMELALERSSLLAAACLLLALRTKNLPVWVRI